MTDITTSCPQMPSPQQSADTPEIAPFDSFYMLHFPADGRGMCRQIAFNLDDQEHLRQLAEWLTDILNAVTSRLHDTTPTVWPFSIPPDQ